MVEAGQAQVPVGGGEGGWATEHIIHHKKLCTVEDDPGDVAEEENNNNADEDSCQVYLTTSMLVSLCVSESELRYDIRILQGLGLVQASATEWGVFLKWVKSKTRTRRRKKRERKSMITMVSTCRLN